MAASEANVSKIKFVKKLKNKRFCVDRFSKITLKNIQSKLNFAEQETSWDSQEIILESGDLTRKKDLLDKNLGEDEVKEERVKPVPG